MSKVYKAVHTLNRGRGETERLPGSLFVPTAQEIKDFEGLGAIAPANDAEAALFEKQNKARGGKPAPIAAEEVEVALEAEDAEQTRDDRIAELVDNNDRAKLDTLAADAGVENPADLPNKKAVAEAIVDAPATGADLVG